jgi:hypothetical protein
MKISSLAFEGLYWACDPTKRREFFRTLEKESPCIGAVWYVEMPVTVSEALETGLLQRKVKFVAVDNGTWDLG